MMSDIYRKYFQKSFSFLYPLLGFDKNLKTKPKQTYIIWEDVFKTDSRKLVCVYKRDTSSEWKIFEREHLISHRMLDYCLPIDDDTIVYVFDFNTYQDDYDNFLEGKYSKFSKHAKQILGDYYGVHTPEWVFIESYLYPESYFQRYSEILLVDVELLKKVGELCPIFDEEKEKYQVKHPELT
jgi:hypothetical protein